jgi:hypothetical protein
MSPPTRDWQPQSAAPSRSASRSTVPPARQRRAARARPSPTYSAQHPAQRRARRHRQPRLHAHGVCGHGYRFGRGQLHRPAHGSVRGCDWSGRHRFPSGHAHRRWGSSVDFGYGRPCRDRCGCQWHRDRRRWHGCARRHPARLHGRGIGRRRDGHALSHDRRHRRHREHGRNRRLRADVDGNRRGRHRHRDREHAALDLRIRRWDRNGRRRYGDRLSRRWHAERHRRHRKRRRRRSEPHG